MDFIRTIAEAIYLWALDANASGFNIICNNDVTSWTLIMLVLITALTVLSFYYVVAKVASNATRRNYLVVFGLGLLVLMLAVFIIVPTIVDNWEYTFDENNLRLAGINAIYYIIVYEVSSLFAKEASNAKHIHLFNCFF